jgi:hypothetical protein
VGCREGTDDRDRGGCFLRMRKQVDLPGRTKNPRCVHTYQETFRIPRENKTRTEETDITVLTTDSDTSFSTTHRTGQKIQKTIEDLIDMFAVFHGAKAKPLFLAGVYRLVTKEEHLPNIPQFSSLKDSKSCRVSSLPLGK